MEGRKIRTIYIGPWDISSQADDFKSGFGKLNIKVKLLKNSEDRIFQKSKVDIHLYKLNNLIPLFKPRRISTRLRNFWIKCVERYVNNKLEKDCDVFIYMYSTLKKDFSDVVWLKSRGVKIVFFFVGDDIRWYHSMKQEFELYDLPPIEYSNEYFKSEAYRNDRIEFLRNAEKYADLIFSHPNQSQLALRPYFKGFVMIDTEKIKHYPNQRIENPVVMHAPTSFEGKGSRFVIEAVNKLQKEGLKFEFKLIQNVSYNEILEIYKDADILIGQLLSPGGGKQERELMAMGKVVLSSAGYDYDPSLLKAGCPMVDVNPDNIYDVLKKIITDYQLRVDIALKGRPYIQKYHTPDNFCKRILELIETDSEKYTYDYYPTFFRNKFKPESDESISVYNYWNNQVKDCSWYKKAVIPGERDGLIF